MKVRWSQDSLRLRITPSELAFISRGEDVGQELHVSGGACWRVAVASGPRTDLVSDGQGVQVVLSPADRERLAQPDAEGVYFQTPAGLRYYVEKDFPCIHPRAVEALEPVTETFEAPPGFEDRKQESEMEIHGD